MLAETQADEILHETILVFDIRFSGNFTLRSVLSAHAEKHRRATGIFNSCITAELNEIGIGQKCSNVVSVMLYLFNLLDSEVNVWVFRSLGFSGESKNTSVA